MDRRLLTVTGMSILLALVVSGIFYQFVVRANGSSTKRQAPADQRDLVASAQALPVGATIKPAEVKVIKVPASLFPRGGFSKVEEVIDRPVVSPILLDEPILEGRLAARGSGSGLAPIIPSGMRAVAVRVNDVVGVAGFVLPGMRVDVLVTGRPPNYAGTVTTTVLQNILVLAAGQTIQPEARGQAINVPVVTLAVSPAQAEILTLAGNEGHIQLVLRNAKDQNVENTPGRETAELYGLRRTRSNQETERRPKPIPKMRTVFMPPAPPPARPAAPAVEEVVMIRGNQKTVEVIGIKKPAPDAVSNHP